MPNRSNIEIEIYGMEGIPPEDIREHEKQKTGNYVSFVLHYKFIIIIIPHIYKDVIVITK